MLLRSQPVAASKAITDFASLRVSYFSRDIARGSSFQTHRLYRTESSSKTSNSKPIVNGIPSKYADFSKNLDEMSKYKFIPNKTDFIKNLDQVYYEYQGIMNQSQELDALKLRDTNLFLGMFLKLGRLKRAHDVLTDLIQLDESLVFGEARDIDTVRNYLKVRCGSYSNLWYGDRSYEITDDTYIFNLIDYSLQNKFSYWDTEICYTLGRMNRIELLNKFTTKKWGISIQGPDFVSGEVHKAPNSEVVTALMKVICYIYSDGMHEANKFLNGILEKHPNINLDINFWRQLMLEGCSPKRGNKDFAVGNENGLDCWNTMKQWHNMRRRTIPFDYSITKELYRILERTKNLKDCIAVYTNCFTEFYEQRNKIENSEWSIICKYQKFIIRRLINKKKYSKTEEFITQWSLDSGNEAMLRKFSSYLIVLKNNKKTNENYDEMVDDDTILGPLW
ncbi:similar to Saccharomyces cerevisiae YMR282C AEP2 Mitochondrial protein, likely involved in translation of the mitochondrial OLI1 mRNA [Maudiozyma barnettii]|uniref:ATPase expression protein 2, mitochondrial n=1 Tax=Maudiozyma barnettii TaxID=61262 RepID=A0A8H2VC77_9SACH|nr:Aep2p [Kazachstania barnettii]CAB4252622.1 similar to Saccharomyces cerevisiae YMR282C AEP2 Mitochondrial protein, likely involved in translation of the mitochondrial OLI1 mRNA [Kazachstania barnettii]CAD1780083.1 similar to Saccharomyces cerevisiae YMR282C AEP2 Mitochondrial protein, likely involved in translation of the mitochondrial OLI1 mRNA [Kazachstania barnettii]